MGPFPSLCLYQRTITSIPIPSISWRDDKLYHDASSDTAFSCLVVVMIAMSILLNHHYKGQLSTNVPSPFEPYKNPTETKQKEGATLWVLSPTLSLRVSIHSKVWLGLRRVCPDNPFGHLHIGKQRAQIPTSKQELSLPLPKGGIHPQLTWYQHWRRLWERNKNVNILKKLIVNHG